LFSCKSLKCFLKHIALTLIYCTITCAYVSAQDIQVMRNSWDYGSIAFWKNDTAHFQIRNAGKKELVFLPIFYNEKFRVIFSKQKLLPGETGEIKVIYYTRDKGNIDQEVPVYVNLREEPLIFRLKGNIKGFHTDAMLRCPTVNSGGASPQDLAKVFTLEVRDEQTHELLSADRLVVKDRSGKPMKVERSAGSYEMLVSPGAYLVDARKKGYIDYYAAVQFQPYQTRMVVYLDKEITPIAEDWPEDMPTEVISPPTKPPIVSDPPVDPEPQQTEPPLPASNPEPAIENPAIPEQPKLDPYLHNANNIVLVLDISNSMRREGKLELLQTAMRRMAGALRPMDKVTIITLAGEAQIVFSPAFIERPDSLLKVINGLKPSGGTNGAAAMRLAYTTALKEKIEGGNNQVIVATDGVFTAGTMGNEELLKLVNQHREKGIRLSTLGFGESKRPLDFLAALAVTGGGDYLHIQDEGVATGGLVEQLKRQSRK
jgi:hypothetical protein